jgi:hypothetical protein
MSPPLAVVVHQAPGRLRLRVPARRGDPAFLGQVGQALLATPGIRAVDVNPVTASLLVRFDGDGTRVLEAVPAAGVRLGDAAQAAAEEEAVRRAHRPQGNLVDRIADAVDGVDAELKRSSEGRMDLQSAAMVYLVFAGFVQLLRGRALPPAHTLFQQAASLAWKRRSERKRAHGT